MCNAHDCPHVPGRRVFLASALAAGVLATPFARAQALTREKRDAMTPDEVLEAMKKGNERFIAGKPSARDPRMLQRETAAGQNPKAVLLSCIDSRAPAETILDMGIGDIFNSRLAGNVVNEDVLGGMEFACAAAGAKVVLVMGHTACGAVKGAVDNAKLGNLTALVAKIQPAVAATTYTGDRSGKNYGFVDAVARKHVELAVAEVRKRSSVLADLEKKGQIRIAGSMYDLKTGKVEFLA